MSRRQTSESEWAPYPDFTAMSDANLDLQEGILQDKISSASEDGDGTRQSYWESGMALLQAERAKRNGGKSKAPVKLELQPEALHGLVGDIVKAILPHTEAHPAATLIHLLVSFGNIIGHNARFRVEHTPHYLNLFATLVGATSRSRKGTSRSTPDHIFKQLDSSWHALRIKSGLSSGQGLIWAVRDPVVESQPIKDSKGKATGEYHDVVADKGEEDKRLLVVEEEFAQALKLIPSDGNILSATIRDAWDSGNLNTLTSGRRFRPVTATDAHISIIGHITQEELLRHLDNTEQCNGFANRFLWALIERSKRIPNPKGVPDEILEPLIDQLRNAVDFAIKAGEIRRDDGAEEIWSVCYEKLTDDMPGIVGAITSRGAPQVMRLACLYALLDLSTLVCPKHLHAALALWDYCFCSAQMIFGDSIGDPIADRILNAIRQNDKGMSRDDLCNMFSRHTDGIDRALTTLLQRGLIEAVVQATGGRPKTIYCAKGRQP